ncbi:hypothetical protein D3C72_1948560 [compost metagenome]
MDSALRSTIFSEAWMCTMMAGWASLKRARRGISQRSANARVVESWMASPARGPPIRAKAWAIWSKPSRSRGKIVLPTGVRVTVRPRSSSFWPIPASSWRTWWLTAATVTESSSAAAEKLR